MASTSSKTASIGRLGEIAQVAVRHGFGFVARRAPRTGDDELGDAARPAPARDARRARADVRQVRPAALDPAGHRPARHHRRAARPPGRRQAVPVRRRRARDPRGARAADRAALPRVRRDSRSRRRRSARCTAPCCPNGRRVAVKVQRPNAPRQIESDIQLLEQAARLVKERVRALDFVDTREIVDEFARSIRLELDYRQEGRNAQAFHRNFAGHPHVAVPRVYWSYTSKRRADARVPRRRPARRPRARRVDDRAAPPPRLRDRRGLADDDLPPRLLPRRPAPGEHPRALARAHRRSSTSGSRESSPTATCRS